MSRPGLLRNRTIGTDGGFVRGMRKLANPLLELGLDLLRLRLSKSFLRQGLLRGFRILFSAGPLLAESMSYLQS